MKEKLIESINSILVEMGAKNPTVSLDFPVYLEMGDYSTSVAMVCAKELNKNPFDLAQDLKDKLLDKKIKYISKIEVVKPGFINFFFDSQYYAETVHNIISNGQKFGQNENLKKQKFIIEYTDPNPFKEFHIGHLMSNSIGEAISRIIENSGAEVKRLSYGGDVGLHVAKAIFGLLLREEEIEEVKNKNEKEQLKFWSSSYVFGSSKYEEDSDAKIKIDNLNKIIFDRSDEKINELYKWGREVSIKHFQEMFKLLNTNFDKNYWESEVVDDGLSAVEDGLSKNILEKSDGAVIFRGENYSLHTRVFVNSKGVPTYEAKELGLGIKKMNDFDFDKSIVITGNEQNDYFKVVLKVMELIKPELSGKTVHIGHGMLRFASGKMSSRKGNVITGEDLIEDVKQKILEKMSGREVADDKKAEIAEIVAVGALKFSILKQTIGKDIIFDMEKSVSFEGDSGPYLQYATVRANSVLKKSKSSGLDLNAKLPTGWQITNLERLLERFPSITERAGKELVSNHIVTYLTELAGEFNSFYATNKIIDESDPTSQYKLAITKSFAEVMESGLNLLGIKVPEEM